MFRRVIWSGSVIGDRGRQRTQQREPADKPDEDQIQQAHRYEATILPGLPLRTACQTRRSATYIPI
jgi:hypothetical protein